MVLIRAMHTLRRIGEKVAGGVRTIGSKASTFLMKAAPAVAAFGAPGLSAGMVAASGIGRGVTTVAGLAQDALRGGVSVQSAQDGVRTVTDTARSMQQQAVALKQAYHGTKGRVASEIERLRG